MQIKLIKVDHWYETKLGIGKAVRVGGNWPVSVRIDITKPFSRGILSVAPREVIRELSEADVEAAPWVSDGKVYGL